MIVIISWGSLSLKVKAAQSIKNWLTRGIVISAPLLVKGGLSASWLAGEGSGTSPGLSALPENPGEAPGLLLDWHIATKSLSWYVFIRNLLFFEWVGF